MRERLAERVRQFRAKAHPIISNTSIVLVLLMLVASGVAVSQTTVYTYDFEEYAVGTQGPGPWSEGTVSNQSFYGDRSLHVEEGEDPSNDEVDVNLSQVNISGTINTTGPARIEVNNSTTSTLDLAIHLYSDGLALEIDGTQYIGPMVQDGVWYDFNVYTNDTHTILEVHESANEAQNFTISAPETPSVSTASGLALDNFGAGTEGYYDNLTFNGAPGGGGGTDQDSQLEMDTRDYIKPNESAPYSVHFNDSGSWSEVTENATVTSNNTSVIVVNAAENLLEGQAGVNTTVNVTANYTASDGNVYSTTKQITVATATVENLEILPAIWRFGATFGDDTIFFLIIATLTSIVATRFSTAFGGLSLYWVVVMLGWFSGWVSVGILMLATVMCMFIGLNLAANINYGAVGSFGRR